MRSRNGYDRHIDRRLFLKGLGAMGLAPLLPRSLGAADLDFDRIGFDEGLFARYDAQTIVIFLYGGPSELAGNLTNIEEIDAKSQNPYPLGNDRYMRITPNKFWANAGGEAMERMLAAGDMNIFRTCYRRVDDLKAHGECTSQAQRGKATEGGAGIVANLAAILHRAGVVTEPVGDDEIGKAIPFVTMEGESTFFTEEDLDLPAFLKPVAFGTGSRNPYERSGWGYDERILFPDANRTLGAYFDALSFRHIPENRIRESFQRRATLEAFVRRIDEVALPEGVAYPQNNPFAQRLHLAMNLLIENPWTRLVSMGSPGLGGWDDHSNAIDGYTRRMRDLMEAIEAALAHMKAAGRENINIVVFGEFGRNVNYNNSLGWDHGNNQNLYWFGGRKFMNRLGIVGETEVVGEGTRLYTRPKKGSYTFQVFSVAATLYRMYGIENPEVLTRGNPIIRDLLF